MRIISGAYKGRLIQALPTNATRPTTDRVREAWASTTENLLTSGFDGCVVLDAFAGSGALGIEALSRGAARVVFCEKSAAAFSVLRENTAALGLSDSLCVKLVHADTLKLNTLSSLSHFGPFDLLVLDPPYSLSTIAVARVLSALSSGGALSAGCIISYEQARPNRLDETSLISWLQRIPCPPHTSFILEARKTYGTVALDYLRFDAG
ncbi:MAG: 16S rRNA (guanine(966)-N(2))-methyltransferase RsmD [Coriobacteriia bacterium]|nr:16S rRNA (guanine(966)-N(2))-methyltransferase RsmD [Coriobacteriia bacterium]